MSGAYCERKIEKLPCDCEQCASDAFQAAFDAMPEAQPPKGLGACPGSQATPGAAEEASPPIGFDPARDTLLALDEWLKDRARVLSERCSVFINRCGDISDPGYRVLLGEHRAYLATRSYVHGTLLAIATEAHRAATVEQGAVHEGAGLKGIAQGPSQ